jgi:hypothetical protein
MRRMIKAALVAASLSGIGASVALAQSPSGTTGTGAGTGGSSSTLGAGEMRKTKEWGTSTPASELRTVTLTVKEVNPSSHHVVFDAKVKPEAVSSSGEPIRIDSLRQGDQVRASFDPATGDITRIDVLAKAR